MQRETIYAGLRLLETTRAPAPTAVTPYVWSSDDSRKRLIFTKEQPFLEGEAYEHWMKAKEKLTMLLRPSTRVYFPGGVMFELRKSLAEDCHLCKDRKRRPALQKRLGQMKMLLSWEVSKHELGLDACRVRLWQLLIEVRSILAACERLTGQYFPGRKILFESDANALNLINVNATLGVDEYNKIADLIEAKQNKLFDIKLAGRIEKIEKNAIDEAVEERVASIIAFAKSGV